MHSELLRKAINNQLALQNSPITSWLPCNVMKHKGLVEKNRNIPQNPHLRVLDPFHTQEINKEMKSIH